MSSLKKDDILKRVSEDQLINADFHHRNLPIITKFVLNNSGNAADAQDIFHDALVITYQKLKADSLQLNCSLSTYVYAVSRNIWMNTLRKRNKTLLQNEPLEIPEDLNQSIIETINNKEKQLLFQKHFMKLGAACQNILLHYFDGKSMKEISDLMNYSTGYSRKKKFKCKKKLLEMIEADSLFRELHTDPNRRKL